MTALGMLQDIAALLALLAGGILAGWIAREEWTRWRLRRRTRRHINRALGTIHEGKSSPFMKDPWS